MFFSFHGWFRLPTLTTDLGLRRSRSVHKWQWGRKGFLLSTIPTTTIIEKRNLTVKRWWLLLLSNFKIQTFTTTTLTEHISIWMTIFVFVLTHVYFCRFLRRRRQLMILSKQLLLINTHLILSHPFVISTRMVSHLLSHDFAPTYVPILFVDHWHWFALSIFSFDLW